MTFFSSLARTGFAGLTSRPDLAAIHRTAAIFQAVWRKIVWSYTVSCNSLIRAPRFPLKLHWLRPLRFLLSIYTLYCAAVRLCQTPGTDWSSSRALGPPSALEKTLRNNSCQSCQWLNLVLAHVYDCITEGVVSLPGGKDHIASYLEREREQKTSEKKRIAECVKPAKFNV